VEFIPDELEDATLYVSMTYGTAAHRCCCGCGAEITTPLTPTDWQLYFDGISVSLRPSIGNWSLPCRSHYWIDHNRVRSAAQMSQQQIALGREHDRRAKAAYFSHDADWADQTGVLRTTPRWPARVWQTLKGLLRTPGR
jgi:Family of unknown function (DUF6527)